MAEEKEKSEDDPSIEEILDSIRQIIADDEEEDADSTQDTEDTPEEVVAEEPEPEPEPEPEEEEVLELTDKIIEISEEPDPEPEPEPPPQPEPEPEVEDSEQIEVDLRDVDEVEPVEESDSLLTEAAEEAAFEAIAKLAKKTAIEANGITLEEIVRQELRPLLRGWLDKNLQGVIERLVREELERVSSRVMDE